MLKKVIFISLTLILLTIFLFTTLASLSLNTNDRVKLGSDIERYVLKGVYIVDVVSERRQNILYDIYVSFGKIVEIVPHFSDHKLKHREEYLPINLIGKYVMPGLIDSHVHIEDSAYLSSALAHGVTTVRGMRGNEKQLEWRKQLLKRKWSGSDFYVTSPILGGNESDPFQLVLKDAQSVKSIVSKLHESGYDFIKYYGNSNSQIFNELINSTKKLKIPLAQHGFLFPNEMSINEFENLKSLEHIENVFSDLLNYEFDKTKLIKVSEELQKLNVPIVTTLSVFEELTLLSLEKEKYLASVDIELMNPAHYWLIEQLEVSRWLQSSIKQAEYNQKVLTFMKDITKTLHLSGVNLALGSDSGALIGQAGVSTINELKLLKSAGLNNSSIIRIATANSAAAIGLQDVGAVKVGFEADMVILDTDPRLDLFSIENPCSVISNGVIYNEDDIGRLKRNAKLTGGFFSSLVFQVRYVLNLALLSVLS